jgi:hypothetical protein
LPAAARIIWRHSEASIGYPGSIAFDTAGNTYIADSYSSHIFKVDTTGTVTVVAGNGTLGYSGDGGPATSAALNGPEGVFVDSSGNIYIADTGNDLIRVVNTGTVQITIAGIAIPAGDIANGGWDILPRLTGKVDVCTPATAGPATSADLNAILSASQSTATGDIFLSRTQTMRRSARFRASSGNI